MQEHGEIKGFSSDYSSSSKQILHVLNYSLEQSILYIRFSLGVNYSVSP